MKVLGTGVRWWARAISMACLLGLMGLSGAARADTVPYTQTPANDWGVRQHSGTSDNTAYVVTLVGNTVYVGGEFDRVSDAGTSSSTWPYRDNVAAFHRDTQQHLDDFVVNTDGVVRSIAGNANTIYIGGNFSEVNGVARENIAAVDATTGAVKPGFVANTNAGSGTTVYALELDGNDLYMGGNFTRVNGDSQHRNIARVDAATGQPDGAFNPGIVGGVRQIQVAPNGNIYAAGGFTSVNGEDRRFLTALRPSDGAPVGPDSYERLEYILLDMDLSDDGSMVFGATGGQGSQANRAQAWSTADGDREWSERTDGDIQAIRYFDGNVYFGFHDGYQLNPPTVDTLIKLLVADAVSGDIESWIPRIDSGLGVWSIDADPYALVVGGAFTNFGPEGNMKRVDRLAILPSGLTPDYPPGPVSGLQVTGANATSISLSWGAASDDVGIAEYEVRRNGEVVGSPSSTSLTAGGLPISTSHTFDVTPIDTAGQRGPTRSVDASTTALPAPTNLYVSQVSPDSARLAWQTVPEAASYELIRDGSVVGSTAGTTLLDVGLTPETTYTYAVRSVLGSERSSPSNSVDITTLAEGQAPIDLEGRFTDDNGSVFEADIEWLAAEGVTFGCNPPDNTRFCPDDPVTRGQMAAFLTRFLGLSAGAGSDLFVDDDRSVFEGDIDRLGTADITRGCNPPTNDRFCPDGVVTRGQMAAFLTRALGLVDDGGGNDFVDDDSSVFEGDIARLAAADITRGCNPPENSRFCPDDPVTRGQMAAFLHRADEYR